MIAIKHKMSDNMKAIQALEDKYGLVLFRMALTQLVYVGVMHFTGDAIEVDIEQIKVQAEADKAKGVHPIMTMEFQCDIIRCAAELATTFSIWTLFEYIQKYVVVKN